MIDRYQNKLYIMEKNILYFSTINCIFSILLTTIISCLNKEDLIKQENNSF